MKKLNNKIKKSKLAVFDIDGTIFRSSLQRELIMALVKYGVFPSIVRKELEKDYFSWVDRRGNYEDYINRVVEVYQRRIKGVAVADVKRVARVVIESQKNRVYTYTRDLINKIRQSHFLLAISGSPSEIVKEFNRYWRFNAIAAMKFEISKGYYTGKVLFVPIHDKRAIVNDCYKELNIARRGSIGVGDTENDASFLSIVEKPICFNPNRNLYKIARAKNWPVVVERKDVIYYI